MLQALTQFSRKWFWNFTTFQKFSRKWVWNVTTFQTILCKVVL